MDYIKEFKLRHGDALKLSMSDKSKHYTVKAKEVEALIEDFCVEHDIGARTVKTLKPLLISACNQYKYAASSENMDMFFNVKSGGSLFLDISYKLGKFGNKISIPCDRALLKSLVDRLEALLMNPDDITVKTWDKEKSVYNLLDISIDL